MEKQKAFLEQARKNNRLAHAYALVGGPYVRKTELALDFAQRLGADPKLDIFLFDAPLGLTIEQARALRRQLSLTSMSGGYKVGIITHAERMGREAANSLLKLLEEPPRQTIIFLTTENFYALLPTMQSRLQVVNFARLKISDFAENFPEKETWEEFSKNFDMLRDRNLSNRLQTAEAIAAYDHEQIQSYLKFAIELWVAGEELDDVGSKLLTAFQDLNKNVNKKLVIDNLYI